MRRSLAWSAAMRRAASAPSRLCLNASGSNAASDSRLRLVACSSVINTLLRMLSVAFMMLRHARHLARSSTLRTQLRSAKEGDWSGSTVAGPIGRDFERQYLTDLGRRAIVALAVVDRRAKVSPSWGMRMRPNGDGPCDHIYGVNNTDFFQRKCPNCQDGCPILLCLSHSFTFTGTVPSCEPSHVQGPLG